MQFEAETLPTEYWSRFSFAAQKLGNQLSDFVNQIIYINSVLKTLQ